MANAFTDNHVAALNKLLANACPRDTDADGNSIFVIDLHCATATVVARPCGMFEFEIVSVTIADS